MQLNKSQSVGLITLLITGGSWCGTANAAMIQVCATCNYKTIQSAVNAAIDNDTINIAAGVYTENISIAGKSIALNGAGVVTNGQTLVVAAGRGPVFTLGSGVAGDPNKAVVMTGMVISGGNHSGGTGVGGGIQVRAGAYLQISGCTVTGNYATFGGGIGINNPGAPRSSIANCVISHNLSPGTPRGVGFGGGIYVRNGSSAYLYNDTIDFNQSREGGGIYSDANTSLVLLQTVVNGNQTFAFSTPQGPTDGDGGGISASGDFNISDSFIVNNVSSGTNGAGGLHLIVAPTGEHVITRTTVSHNGVGADDLVGGGILADGGGGTWTLDDSFVIQNNNGGGVVNGAGTTLVVTNGTVINQNTGGDLCNQAPDGGCQ
jgi:hypothetical protein